MTEHALLTATTIRLRDGRTTTIRPLDPNDRPALLAFGHALPPEELLYMQDDFSSPEVISRLTGACAADHWRQFLAVAGDMVVGYGAALRLAGWSSHVAEIQLIVSRGWRRGGLGTAMAPVLLDAAQELGATRAVVEILEAQTTGLAIFERLGFQVEGRLDRHVCDRTGCSHTMLVLARQIDQDDEQSI